MSRAIPGHPAIPARRGARMIVLVSVILPPLALITVMWLAWGWGFGILDLSIFAGMYLLCGLGITIGFHRYFTHKSFDCPRWVKLLLGISGSMAVQGDLLWWCAVHRMHHQHSDEVEDPHSPHVGSESRIRRFLYSHFGWLFRIEQPDQGSLVLEGPAFHGALLGEPRVAPAPRLGEHTREICREWLGMDDSEIERCIADGILEVAPAPSD